MLEAGLYTYLTAQSGVTALIGTKLYPVTAPQGTTLPYVVYSKIDTRPVQALGQAAGMATSRLQFDAYAATPLAAKNLIQALRVALDGKQGAWGSTVIGSSLWLNEIDLYEQETASHRIAVDFDITYEV